MKGKIYIIGDIGYCGDDIQGIELVDVITQVKNQPDATSFDVFINSGGGNVETGEDIYNYLKNLAVPVTTIGTGIVASIATVIFMAGTTRIISPNTDFMIHLPMGSISYSTADELDAYSKEVKVIENRMVKFYASETNLEPEAVLPLLRNETWLTEEQLKTFGFTNGQPMLAVAKANLNINPKNKKMSKKDSNMLQKIFDFITKDSPVIGKILYNADEQEVDFFELDSEAEPQVGDKATIDGEPAEGSYVMANGETFVFVSGELTEIIEVETEEEEEEDEEEEMTLEEALQALDVANAEVLDLTGTNETLTKDKDALTKEVARLTAEGKKNKETVAKIEALRSKLSKSNKNKSGGKETKQKPTSRFKKAMADVK